MLLGKLDDILLYNTSKFRLKKKALIKNRSQILVLPSGGDANNNHILV